MKKILVAIVMFGTVMAGRALPVKNAKPTKTAVPSPVPTADARIDEAKFEKLYRAGKVLGTAAYDTPRKFKDANDSFTVELKIAYDHASTPAENRLIKAYMNVQIAAASVELSGQFGLKDSAAEVEKLRSALAAAEAIYLGKSAGDDNPK